MRALLVTKHAASTASSSAAPTAARLVAASALRLRAPQRSSHTHAADAEVVAAQPSATRRAAAGVCTFLRQRRTPLRLALVMSGCVAAAASVALAPPVAAAPSSPSPPVASVAWVAPAPTLWSRVRSVWIPTSEQALWAAEQRTFATAIDAERFPYRSTLVPVPPHPLAKEKQWHINTLTLTNPQLQQQHQQEQAAANVAAASKPPPLVLLHGFGAGIGLWMNNYNLLASNFAETHALDMLGWGRSTRADFNALLERRMKEAGLEQVRKAAKTPEAMAAYRAQVATLAEEFTVDSLENWRVEMGIEQFHLCGHSMGGYLAGAYALKYPNRVASLVLASPIGVPHAKELRIDHFSFAARQTIALFRSLWWGSPNVTPQSIVRFLGRMGPKPVHGYVTRRFAADERELDQREKAGPPRRGESTLSNEAAAARSASAAADVAAAAETAAAAAAEAAPDRAVGEEAKADSRVPGGDLAELDDSFQAASKVAASVAFEARASSASASASAASPLPSSYFDKPVVADYLYHLCAAPGSGEFAFARLFNESGFAHKPLIASLPSRAREGVLPPVTLLYGTHDWMDYSAGVETAELINAAGGRAQCLRVAKAGHQLFADNPRDFIDKLKRGVTLARPPAPAVPAPAAQ
jgi:pimeloyl-ACP methyl ester carboxylesterase